MNVRNLYLILAVGRVIAQAVSGHLAWVRSQVRSYGICNAQIGTGVGFLQVLHFPLPILIPPTAPNSSVIIIIRGWYNRPNRGGGVPHLTNKKKFWEELIAYFPLYDTGHIENDTSNSSSIVACVFVTTVTFLPSRCLATIRGIHIQTHRLMGGNF
jgi:hypothetical protein